MRLLQGLACVAFLGVLPAISAEPPTIEQEPNTWVKRSPLKDTPVSPSLGYEGSYGYDPVARRLIRWAGHNQGGGGEQNAETWLLDPVTLRWELKEPNRSPPGVCCAQQNIFDPVGSRFLRFSGFSGNHGWHWFRENYLNNSAVWSYDPSQNRWRDLHTLPGPRPAALRCAAWDRHHEVVVVFGGEGSNDGTLAYDPYTNTWTRLRPPVEPAGRSGGNLAYDAARRLHILFGAQLSDDPHTWAYDLARNEWRDLKPATQPPTEHNDAVLAYDDASRSVVAVVRVIDAKDGMEVTRGHLETWSYDAGKNTWRALKPAREPDGWGNRRRIMTAIPDQQLLLMEAYVNPSERVPGVEREQQIWTYRVGPIQAARTPSPPEGVSVATQPGKAIVTWQPVKGAVSYKIMRGEGERPGSATLQEVARVPAAQHSLTDSDRTPTKVYHYTVRSIAADAESEDSRRARTQPRLVEDVTASVISAREVRLRWKPPAGTDIVGYHVERAPVEVFSEDEILRLKKDTPPLDEPSVGAIRSVGTFTRLTKEPLTSGAYTDTTLDLGKPAQVEAPATFTHRFRSDQLDPKGMPYRYAVYAYRVRAVNALGTVGEPSPFVLTIPSAPEGLFAREDDDRCRLKWTANPEEKLRGYRVYRMESPRVNGPGQKVTRLTATPFPEVGYVDAGATRDTKRYWVVAVDALGQEGFPSAPAWHYREYRRFYAPFVGDWHQ